MSERIDGEGSRPPSDLERWLAGLQRTPLSRRGFLRVAGVASASAALAACSRNVAPRTAPTTPAPTTATGTTPAATTPALESELNIYNWAQYLSPENLEAFEREYGISTTQDFYASNEELVAKLQGGATGYDVIAPTGYAVQIMKDEGLLLPLDHARIPNLSHVEDRFLDLSFDPGNTYSVPKDWGTTGFMYISEQVGKEMTSWRDFYEMADDFSGKYTVLDSAPEVIGSALKMLGYSYNSKSQQEVDEALDELIRIKPHIAAIVSSGYRERIQRGEVFVALGWNGDYFYTLEDQPSTKYVIPAEGTEFWVDTWAIPVGAPHPNLAMEFINWILAPERQAQETNFTYYASAVGEAQGLVDQAIAQDPAIYPPPGVTEKLEANDGDPATYELRTQAWTKFKAS